MKSFNKIIMLVFMAMALLAACDDNDTVERAEYVTMDELLKLPGYEWVTYEMKDYSPDPVMVSDIAEAFDINRHRFLFFLKPGCTCIDPEVPLAWMFKTLDEADISDFYREIYIMKDKDIEHPYQDNFQLNRVSSYLLMDMTDTTVILSLRDTIDQIIFYSPDSLKYLNIEELVLHALQK